VFQTEATTGKGLGEVEREEMRLVVIKEVGGVLDGTYTERGTVSSSWEGERCNELIFSFRFPLGVGWAAFHSYRKRDPTDCGYVRGASFGFQVACSGAEAVGGVGGRLIERGRREERRFEMSCCFCLVVREWFGCERERERKRKRLCVVVWTFGS